MMATDFEFLRFENIILSSDSLTAASSPLEFSLTSVADETVPVFIVSEQPNYYYYYSSLGLAGVLTNYQGQIKVTKRTRGRLDRNVYLHAAG